MNLMSPRRYHHDGIIKQDMTEIHRYSLIKSVNQNRKKITYGCINRVRLDEAKPQLQHNYLASVAHIVSSVINRNVWGFM